MSEKPDAVEYGKALRGLTVNLLVRDIDMSLHFQREVLDATVIYSDLEFAAIEGYGASWMLHADSTYARHPMRGAVEGLETRGGGVEIRLHCCDPDRAEAAARKFDYTVLDASADKPHGVREVFLLDPDGYIWVPDIALS